MASGSAREPDVVIQIDTIAKGESGSTKVSVSMQPLLLTLDLRILDRLQHFIVAPVAPAPSPMYKIINSFGTPFIYLFFYFFILFYLFIHREGEPDDYPPSAPVHRERGSPSSKTVVELKCSMIRLDVSTPRVIDDSMIPNFKPGMLLLLLFKGKVLKTMSQGSISTRRATSSICTTCTLRLEARTWPI